MIALCLSVAALSLFMIIRNSQQSRRPYVHPKLEPYVQSWEQDIRRAGLFSKKGFNQVGKIVLIETDNQYSGRVNLRTREIAINCRQLEMGHFRTLCTVYHELGHLIFRLEHNSCEIMAERCQTEQYIGENWIEMVDEYLQACRKKQNSYGREPALR